MFKKPSRKGNIQYEIYGDNNDKNEVSEDRIDDDENKLDYDGETKENLRRINLIHKISNVE